MKINYTKHIHGRILDAKREAAANNQYIESIELNREESDQLRNWIHSIYLPHEQVFLHPDHCYLYGVKLLLDQKNA